MRAIGVKRTFHCVTELAAASYRASPRLFFSHSISITYRCGPCGVVGDALASSKRSGKSTGWFVGHRHRRWRDNASSPRYTAMSVWTEAQMRTIRGELTIGRIFMPQMGAPLRIVIFRGAVPFESVARAHRLTAVL